MASNFLKRASVLLFAGLLASAGCSGSDGKDATALGTLAGTVTGSTGAAISGVIVTPSPAAVPAVTTDSSGMFSLSLPAGSYTLSFSGDNLEPATSDSKEVEAGKTTTADQVMAASALKVTVNLPAALRNGGPAGFDTNVSDITASATVGGEAVTPDSIEWTITDYYGTMGPPTDVEPAPATGATTSFAIPDFESVREGANAWMNDRYGTTGTEHEFEYIQAPEREQLLSFGVQQVRAMSYKVYAKVTAGDRTSTASAVVAPLTVSSGVNTLPLGMMVVANAASTAAYDWTLQYVATDAPAGTGFGEPPAGVVLQGAATKNPYLVPTVTGVYKLTNGDGEPLHFRVSTYHGSGTADTEEGADGVACSSCHSEEHSLAGKFAEWNASAHGNANFADPFATPTSLFKLGLTGGEGTHYTESCISCHVVGYSKVPSAANGGWDDVAAEVGWTFPTTYDAAAWETVTAQPALLHRAGIQCESCHGPLEPADHSSVAALDYNYDLVPPAASMSAGVCMTCHDALTHHDRGSLWAASGHANTELAVEEGAGSTNCARCHSAEGFMLYLPRQQSGTPGSLASVATLDENTVHSQTCQTCHDPHSTELRVSGDSQTTAGLFNVKNAGAGALCIICHNSRSGAIRQGTYSITSWSRLGPHAACQGDMFAGRNAFFVDNLTATDAADTVPNLSAHAFMADTCVDCHVKWVPEDIKSQYQVWNTNHTFRSSTQVCTECHAAGMGERIQESVQEKMDGLTSALGNVLAARMLAPTGFATAAGYRLDPATGAAQADPANLTILPAEVRAILAVQTTNAVVVQPSASATWPAFRIALDRINLPASTTAMFPIASGGTAQVQTLAKAYFNLLYVVNDGAKGIHNPKFAAEVLDKAKAAVSAITLP